ncbi:uncharacterized protein BXZ73DRAFT_100982 [Epithele typhae]|uniref:uncharacterized protein n=1 Tax=Epithele typhae TaxID=378194 RepID=UPI002008E616|nr:uncharacterized protein BXZ73DRAFT_100982 [Epithele typhae]KAH9933600.1 hypothetical protein BXZ73DRAFT_100982 [Epithele typhae]
MTLSDATGLVSASINLDGAFGAILVGTFLGLILYGTALHQSYRYWRMNPTESCAIRLIVITLIVLETIHAIMTMHTCYYYLVTHYAQPQILDQIVWSLDLLFFIASLIAFTSQLFFAKRVSLIGTPYLLVTAVVWLVEVTLASATGADVVLTSALLSVLYRDPTSRCESWYKKVVVYFINTGLLILLFDLVGLILAATLPSGSLGVWMAVNIITSRLYTNTLLSVLNTRQIFMNRTVDVFHTSTIGLSQNVFARADRMAAVERWNVPQTAPLTVAAAPFSAAFPRSAQVPVQPGPTAIDIKVTKDIEADESDVTSVGSTLVLADRWTRRANRR